MAKKKAKTETKDNPKTTGELEAAVEADRQSRTEQAQLEIDGLCERLKVAIIPWVGVVGNELSSGIRIVAR